MVFFLVSGYIIPASLERRGCVRTFWIGRIYRVYPPWAAVVTVGLALDLWGVAEIRDFGGQSAVTVAAAHVTLLQELLGTPSPGPDVRRGAPGEYRAPLVSRRRTTHTRHPAATNLRSGRPMTTLYAPYVLKLKPELGFHPARHVSLRPTWTELR